VGRDDAAERLFRVGTKLIEDEAGKRTVFCSEIAGDGNGGMRTADKPELVATTDKWSHVVMTYGGGKRRLFVNGTLADEVAVTGKLPTGTVPLTIGGGAKYNEGFSGWLDELAVYHRALTADEVTGHHGVGTGQGGEGRRAVAPHTGVAGVLPGAHVQQRVRLRGIVRRRNRWGILRTHHSNVSHHADTEFAQTFDISRSHS
jgi:hypothetical protein